MGFTCAACHTGRLDLAGKTVIVEGGPALADFWPFLTDAVSALSSALSDSSKFDRFSKSVLKTNNPSTADLDALRQQMKSKLADLQTRLTQNSPKTPRETDGLMLSGISSLAYWRKISLFQTTRNRRMRLKYPHRFPIPSCGIRPTTMWCNGTGQRPILAFYRWVLWPETWAK